MSIQKAIEFIQNALNDDFYRLEFHCIVSDNMHLPKHIKDKFGIGNGIVLALNSNLKHNFEIDGDSVYWDTSFNRVPYTVKIDLQDVITIINTVNGSWIQVQDIKAMINTVKDSLVQVKVKIPKQPQGQQDTQKDKEHEKHVYNLKLVSYNSSYNKTKPTGKLRLVVDNTKKGDKK